MKEKDFIFECIKNELKETKEFEKVLSNKNSNISYEFLNNVFKMFNGSETLIVDFNNNEISGYIKLTVNITDPKFKVLSLFQDKSNDILRLLFNYGLVKFSTSIVNLNKSLFEIKMSNNGKYEAQENTEILDILDEDIEKAIIDNYLKSTTTITSEVQFTGVISNLEILKKYKDFKTYYFSVVGLNITDDLLNRIKENSDPVEGIDSISFQDCEIVIIEEKNKHFFNKGTKFNYINCKKESEFI